MRRKFLVLTVKKLLKSVHIYGSYRKIKTGVSLFWTTRYVCAYNCTIVIHKHNTALNSSDNLHSYDPPDNHHRSDDEESAS